MEGAEHFRVVGARTRDDVDDGPVRREIDAVTDVRAEHGGLVVADGNRALEAVREPGGDARRDADDDADQQRGQAERAQPRPCLGCSASGCASSCRLPLASGPPTQVTTSALRTCQ